MIPQEEYMEKIARRNLEFFLEQGYATAGHNGPHGHKDTPVRNTAHYLVIYSYLYKKYGEEKFAQVCQLFFSYLRECQEKTKSGAIQCMITDRFDRLNGLIGQGWVIESLIYYYETFKVDEALRVAKKIYDSQQYQWDKHLWHRIDLDGTDLGIDVTSNHNVWFAACSYKLAEYLNAPEIDEEIQDFLTKGQHIILNTYSNGLMVHRVVCKDPQFKKGRWKRIVRQVLTPVKFLNPRKLDSHYMENAYHIFDIYGFLLLKEKYGHLPIFNSDSFLHAVALSKDVRKLEKLNKTTDIKTANAYYYTYNSPTFEWPYVAKALGFYDEGVAKELYANQERLTYNPSMDDFSLNNPDIETWNARTYEIIRYLDL